MGVNLKLSSELCVCIQLCKNNLKLCSAEIRRGFFSFNSETSMSLCMLLAADSDSVCPKTNNNHLKINANLIMLEGAYRSLLNQIFSDM